MSDAGMKRSASLVRRLLLSLLGASLLVFAAAEAMIVWRTDVAIEASLHDALTSRAAALAVLLEIDQERAPKEPEFFVEFEAAPSAFAAYADGASAAFSITCDGQAAAIRSERADVFLGLDPVDGAVVGDQPIFTTRRDGARSVEVIALRTYPHPEAGEDRAALTGFFEILQNTVDIARAMALSWSCVVVVGLERSEYDARKQAVLAVSAPALGGGLLLLLALSVLIVHWGLRPLTRLCAELTQLSPQHLKPVSDPSVRELTELAATLNLLMMRLNDAFARERRFMADVAHELRTPVSELRTLAEVTLLTLSHDSPHRANYEDVLTASTRMGATITTMSMLARCDAGRLQAQRAPLDLTALLRDLCTKLTAAATARGLTLVTRLPDAAPLTSDPDALRTILTNLLENAVTYAPPNTAIHLRLDLTPDAFALQLTNDAPSLTAAQVPLLFERFWRQDVSRTDAHSGLGLCLSRSLSHILHLRLDAKLDQQALTMTLAGPREMPATPYE